MSVEHEHMIKMVCQIAANFAYLPDDEAAAAVATHLRKFWAPAMVERLRRDCVAKLDGVPALAVARLGQA